MVLGCLLLLRKDLRLRKWSLSFIFLPSSTTECPMPQTILVQHPSSGPVSSPALSLNVQCPNEYTAWHPRSQPYSLGENIPLESLFSHNSPLSQAQQISADCEMPILLTDLRRDPNMTYRDFQGSTGISQSAHWENESKGLWLWFQGKQIKTQKSKTVGLGIREVHFGLFFSGPIPVLGDQRGHTVIYSYYKGQIREVIGILGFILVSLRNQLPLGWLAFLGFSDSRSQTMRTEKTEDKIDNSCVKDCELWGIRGLMF